MNLQQARVVYAIGFDPGGIKSFGWVVLAKAGRAVTVHASGTCNSAKEAVDQATESLPAEPAAIGADAPLFWSFEGDRVADQTVRALVTESGGHSATVAHVNSLRGACLVQGALVVDYAGRLWPAVPVTEAHPKALLRVCADADKFARRMWLGGEHERDAALAAYTAFKMLEQPRGWRDLLMSEPGELMYPVGLRMSYCFPMERLLDIQPRRGMRASRVRPCAEIELGHEHSASHAAGLSLCLAAMTVIPPRATGEDFSENSTLETDIRGTRHARGRTRLGGQGSAV